MKYLMVLVCGLVFGVAQAADDMEHTMKQMGMYFKQARDSQSVAQMQQAMTGFEATLQQAQQLGFQGEKAKLMQQGLTELNTVSRHTLELLAQQDLQGAKAELDQIDSLRKKYHKERQPSFWQLLFGS